MICEKGVVVLLAAKDHQESSFLQPQTFPTTPTSVILCMCMPHVWDMIVAGQHALHSRPCHLLAAQLILLAAVSPAMAADLHLGAGPSKHLPVKASVVLLSCRNAMDTHLFCYLFYC